jgi:hypothetical protein
MLIERCSTTARNQHGQRGSAETHYSAYMTDRRTHIGRAIAVCPALTCLNRRNTRPIRQGGSTRPTLGICGHLQIFPCCIQQAQPAATNPGTPPTAAPTTTRTLCRRKPIQPFSSRHGVEAASGPLGTVHGTGSDSPARVGVIHRSVHHGISSAVAMYCALGITSISASPWQWRQVDPEHPVMSVILGLESHVGTYDVGAWEVKAGRPVWATWGTLLFLGWSHFDDLEGCGRSGRSQANRRAKTLAYPLELAPMVMTSFEARFESCCSHK